MIPQWIQDSMMNISLWTSLIYVPWMAGFTPLEDIEKHWFSCKRNNSLFFRPSIEVESSVELFKYLNQGLESRDLSLLLENNCFSVSYRGVNHAIHGRQLSEVHTNRFITKSSIHWDIMHVFWHWYLFLIISKTYT